MVSQPGSGEQTTPPRCIRVWRASVWRARVVLSAVSDMKCGSERIEKDRILLRGPDGDT